MAENPSDYQGLQKLMDKVYRNSVSIDVALSSAAKRRSGQVTYAAEPSDSEAPDSVSPISGEGLSPTPGSSKLKALLRPVTKLIFRLTKPILKPIAFRLRQYLTRTILEDLNSASQSIKQDILNTHSASLQTLERISISLSEEIRKTQDLVAKGIAEGAAHAARSQPVIERAEHYSYTTARRFAIPCADGETLVRTSVGYVLCSSSDHALLAQLIDRDLEPGVSQLIQRFLKPGDLFLDVGANVGLHTLAAARAMQGTGKIIAFEPFEATKRLLERTVWINGFSGIVEIHQAAVSHQSGHENLFLGATSGHHSLFSSDNSSQLPSVRVPTVRLDDVIGKDEAISLLKLDVEGAELDVIRGAKEIIGNNFDLAMIVEFGLPHLKNTGHPPDQWISFFTNLGLTYRAINEDTGFLEKITIAQLERMNSVNIFFARPGSQAWSKAGYLL